MFFTGKGGVGKTSLACATAVALADSGRRVLLVSTDPASNLDEVLGVRLSTHPTDVPGVPRLSALNIDPDTAAREYRERVVGPYRALLPESAVARVEEQLSGACTLEIAAFDEFTTLLGDAKTTNDFDHVVFDTAPTSHTLRLLKLPAAWTGFIDTNTTGTSCLGRSRGYKAKSDSTARVFAALADAEVTTVVLVTRPEASALAEAARTSGELADLGVTHQRLIVNGIFTARDGRDDIARTLELRGQDALAALPDRLAPLPRTDVPLLSWAPIGVDGLRRVFGTAAELSTARGAKTPDAPFELPGSISDLIDDIERRGHGVVLTMGKGGVGKTTAAAAIAVELAARGRGLLEEDLRSPCTEEIAVFRAFARAVAEGEHGFVVLDTAPTGHTLLLLDAAEAYHHEVSRTQGDAPDAVRQLLPRLRDPEFTKVLLITLPEATPVHEAAQLQDDLRRAGIEPFAWVVNQSFAGEGIIDPVLRDRGFRERPYLAEVRELLAQRLAWVPWYPEAPVGADRLLEFSRGALQAHLTPASS